MSYNPGGRVMAAGFAVMLLAVSAGVGSGVLLIDFVGILIGANFIAVGVRRMDDDGPATPTGRAAFAGVLRRNLDVAGIISASSAVTAVAGSEAGPMLCCAMLAMLLLGLCFIINIRVLGELLVHAIPFLNAWKLV